VARRRGARSSPRERRSPERLAQHERARTFSIHQLCCAHEVRREIRLCSCHRVDRGRPCGVSAAGPRRGERGPRPHRSTVGEVDARAQHTESAFQGGADLHVFGKTLFKLNASRARVQFADDAVFLGNRLGVELNRVSTGGSVAVQHRLTPFTSLSVTVDRTQDRFEFSPSRDANSTSVAGGVDFATSALISGSASFGYRNFDPLSADLAGYRGATAL